ncbi:hypothetical protein, partial [Stenotrophomonas sp.]|uniref:hypothetical protein n=1 Tax=Stenotrophomonas sp. TaxID=69392 RepID=UPI00289ADC05
LAAASMRLTPRNPTPPHLRQFPAICWNGILLWWVSTLVDTDEFVRYLKDVSTKVDTYQQPAPTPELLRHASVDPRHAWMSSFDI